LTRLGADRIVRTIGRSGIETADNQDAMTNTVIESIPLARRAAPLAPALPAGGPPGSIAFDSGHASPLVLPDLTREAHLALTQYRAETLQYAARAGLPELRRWIAEYMQAEGASVGPENVLVTNGAKHALELVCRALLDDGDAVVVTAPTYFSAIPILRSYGATFVEVPQDRDGMDVDALAAILDRRERDGRPRPKFIYDVPDFHNPTGATLPLERRRALIALAARHRIAVVEDSPYRKVRFVGDSVPSLASLDHDGGVIHLGTFAKLMAPGLRVGWVAAPSSLIARMALLKTDAGSCPLTQRIILEFCTTGGRLPSHIDDVQERYRVNRDRMVAALHRELPNVKFEVPDGGYYLWVCWPEGTDADALTLGAQREGVIVIAGSRFYANAGAGHPRNRMRLAYSHALPDEIDEGVRRLARAYAALAERSGVIAGAAR
jgi:2-aminoadipate transaminase